MELPVQQVDSRVYDALGIISRQGFRPRLQEGVSIVVSVPLNIGSQSVLGFNDAETDAGAAFIGWTSQAANAGAISAVQLLNPAGSGEVVYVDELSVSVTNAADNVHVGFVNAALVTLVGTPVLKYSAFPGALSQEIRRDTPGAAPGTAFKLARAAVILTDYGVVFNPPLRLDAGTGVGAWTESINRGLTVNVSGRKYLAP